MSDADRVREILSAHSSKDFVRRIESWDGGEDEPWLDLGEGMRGTHLMSVSESDGVHYAYPSIVRIGGELKKLSPQEAFRHAMDSGEAIPFDSHEEALWFSKNYKAVWAEYRRLNEESGDE